MSDDLTLHCLSLPPAGGPAAAPLHQQTLHGASPALPLQMFVLEMLVRGIRTLKDAFPESCLAWLPQRLQRDFKAQAQAVGTQGTQVSPGAFSRAQFACALLKSTDAQISVSLAILELCQT